MPIIAKIKSILGLSDAPGSNPSPVSGRSPVSKDLELRFARQLIDDMVSQKDGGVRNGVYEATVVSFVFNHERIEGNVLTEWQTQTIFETRETLIQDSTTPSNVRESANHSLMFDRLLDSLDSPLSLDLIRSLHASLMDGVMAEPGFWKTLPNGVGGIQTTPPQDVPKAMAYLVDAYNHHEASFENIARFHVRFETIHPFPDGNGRVGRAIAFRECLRAGMAPFVVTDETKGEYYGALDTARNDGVDSLCSYFRRQQLEYMRRSTPLLSDPQLICELTEALGIERADIDPSLEFTGPVVEHDPVPIPAARSAVHSGRGPKSLDDHLASARESSSFDCPPFEENDIGQHPER